MSDNITKRVGLGTAYGFAKAGGYEGTVAEFTELLGNIAIDLARIENLSVTVTTLPAGSQATASLNGSVLSLGIPKGDKGDKGNTGDTGAPAGFGTVSATVDANIGTPSVEVTASGADTAKNFAFAFHNLKGQKGDKGDTGEVSEAELTQAFEDFSANGTVANAEQLTTDIRANDQTPYLFRTAGGSVDIGDREYINGIVGGTVAFNQLVANSGSVSVTVPSGHKYFSSIGGTKAIAISNGSAISATGGTDNIIDLTQMFGSTIADYIYSLEQANAGAGVAFFKTLFPKPYYAYNAGELMSVKGLVSHDMVGFNQWDEEWEVGTIDASTGAPATGTGSIRSKNFIPVLPNTTYYIQCPRVVNNQYLSVGDYYAYDVDYNYLGNKLVNNTTAIFTTDSQTHFIKIRPSANYGTTYNHDICINLSWDGSEDGNYEPYQKWSYPLDSDLELRGIPKIENGNLYYDGDVYEPDGTVTRRYGIVDLGTLNWTYIPAQTRFYAIVSDAKFPSGDYSIKANIVCVKYTTVNFNEIQDGQHDKAVAAVTTSFNAVSIRDTAYTDAAAFKAAMSGVYLVYELATPTTETADPYTNPQIVNDFGTEEFVISNTVDVPIPVGHNTDYPVNLKAKVEMAPDSPSGGNGDYIVRQTNGTNEYVSIANNATIQNILARLEALEG